MPTSPRQPPQTPVLDAFVQAIAPLAIRHKITALVIVARDPVSGEARVFGSPEAMEAVREEVEIKFGFGGETAWNDV